MAQREGPRVGPRIARKLSIFVLAGSIGCSWPGAKPVSRTPEAPIAEITRTTEEIRGLSFKRQITLVEQPANGSAANLAQSTLQLAQVYQRLGFLPDSVDLLRDYEAFGRLQRAVSYDARRGSIVVTPTGVRIGQAFAGASGRDGITVAAVLALTHALQEQHFRWQQTLDATASEDRRLAFGALAAGDATTVALHLLNTRESAALWPENAEAIRRLTIELEKAASSLPAILREQLLFPYRNGSQFVQWAYSAKGWAGVNALFADPPVSSAQILHPEQYYLRRRAPLQIVPFGLLRQTNNRVLEQTFGEFLIRLLLASTHSPNDAAQMASGWTGDHVSAQFDGKNSLIVWLSAWSDDNGAQRFARGLQTVLERRRRVHFSAAARQQDGLKADLGAGRTATLQVRGAVVLLLDGLSGARASEMSDVIWKDLEIGAEPALPFETAKRPDHVSLLSR